MTDKKVWLVTGAGRGMGVDIAEAALAGGNSVVATARNADTGHEAGTLRAHDWQGRAGDVDGARASRWPRPVEDHLHEARRRRRGVWP